MSVPWHVEPIQARDYFRDRQPITRDPERRVNYAYNAAPRVPWDVFIGRLDWQQGEHVGLIGPTGQGKTNLLMNLLPLRTYTAVFATKPRDNSMDRLIASGYRKFEQWESVPPERSPKRVIWPNASSIDSQDHQQRVFRRAYAEIYREGGWCTTVDEGFYMSEILALKREMKVTWTQGRSLGISHVVATQRPRWVPLEMYDQSTHLFFWLNNDDESLRRISGLGIASSDVVRTLVQGLEKFQCLYINTRTGDMMRTRAPAPR
jgi:energy-coupling factor transporter ATP-binding protein EcfA2